MVVAIDPGTVDSGVCLAVDGQLVSTATLHVSRGVKGLTRALAMMDLLEQYVLQARMSQFNLYEKYEVHLPYESPAVFHGSRYPGDTFQANQVQGRPIMLLYQLVALIEYWGSKAGFKPFPYLVNDIKEGIAGKRSAPKREVELIMRHEYSLFQVTETTNHEWDAISIFTYHLRQLAVQAAIIPEVR